MSGGVTGTHVLNESGKISDDNARDLAILQRGVFVDHGSTAGTARPSSSVPVKWFGTVAPTNAITNDEWYDRANEILKRYTGSAWVSAGSATYASKKVVLGLFTAEDHGATYDGVTDDSAAIQAAIDACHAAGGGVVSVGATADVDNVLGHRVKINTTLRMKEGVWLRGMGPATALVGTANPMIALPASGVRPDRITISDLVLQTPAGVGISLDVSPLTGGYQLGWARIVVENVTIVDAGSHAFEILTGVIECRLINCVSAYAVGDGFHVVGTDNFLVGCTAGEGSSNGFLVLGGNTKLTACKGYGNDLHGFTVSGAGRHMLVGCEAQDNGSGTVYGGFNVDSSNNTLAGCVSDTNKAFAFQLSGGNNTCTGCVPIYGGGGTGFVTPTGYVLGGSGGHYVAGPRGNCATPVAGVVAGSTILLSGASGSTVDVPYAATITPDPYSGELQRITLTGACTISAPAVAHAGQRLAFELTQDATGGRTVTFSTDYLSSWTPDTTARKINMIAFQYDGHKWMQLTNVTGLFSPFWSDTYTRVDASTLGSTEGSTATAWTAWLGTAGIIGNQAAGLTFVSDGHGGNQSIQAVPLGRTVSRVKATIAVRDNGNTGIAMGVDGSNYYGLSNGLLFKRVGGAYTELLTGFGGIGLTDGVFELRYSSGSITVMVNGGAVGSVGDTSIVPTGAAIILGTTSDRIDLFEAE